MAEAFAVRISAKDGFIEVSAPEKEWVDAQLERFSSILERAEGGPPDAPEAPSPAGKTLHADRKAAPSRKRAAASKGSSGRAARNPELAELLTRDIKRKLEEYVGARKTSWDKSQPAQAAIVATFLQDELNWQGIDHHDLYTVYTEMGYPIPGNLRSQLLNARQRAKFFHGIRDGKYELSHAGENFARHGSLIADQEAS